MRLEEKHCLRLCLDISCHIIDRCSISKICMKLSLFIQVLLCTCKNVTLTNHSVSFRTKTHEEGLTANSTSIRDFIETINYLFMFCI